VIAILENDGEIEMKLSPEQVELVSAAVGAEPIAESTIAHNHLKDHFGDHTFYLGPAGAYVWEAAGEGEDSTFRLEAVHIASWADEERTLLQKESPTPTGAAVTLN
jgi:hypothetical protein